MLSLLGDAAGYVVAFLGVLVVIACVLAPYAAACQPETDTPTDTHPTPPRKA